MCITETEPGKTDASVLHKHCYHKSTMITYRCCLDMGNTINLKNDGCRIAKSKFHKNVCKLDNKTFSTYPMFLQRPKRIMWSGTKVMYNNALTQCMQSFEKLDLARLNYA